MPYVCPLDGALQYFVLSVVHTPVMVSCDHKIVKFVSNTGVLQRRFALILVLVPVKEEF